MAVGGWSCTRVYLGFLGTDVQIGGGKTLHLGAPPELQLPPAELNQVRHRSVLGHGLAVQAIRACGPPSIFITENGCAAADQRSDDGNIYDSDRVMFLRPA
jgi:hypothetical protein